MKLNLRKEIKKRAEACNQTSRNDNQTPQTAGLKTVQNTTNMNANSVGPMAEEPGDVNEALASLLGIDEFPSNRVSPDLNRGIYPDLPS